MPRFHLSGSSDKDESPDSGDGPEDPVRAARRQRRERRETLKREQVAKNRKETRRSLTKILLLVSIPPLLIFLWIHFGPKPPGRVFYPVHGVIVFPDGAPVVELAGGVVSFESKSGKKSARATVRPDATFDLTTFGPGDGAPVGEYRVLIQGPKPSHMGGAAPRVIDPKYAKYDTSQLTAVVRAETNRFQLQVERPGFAAKR